jgi:tetratricopeptide (TPR) repeat protein
MSKKTNTNTTITKNKEISTIKLFYFLLFLVLIGMVILYAADTFTPLPGVSIAGNFNRAPGTQEDPHSGADLSQLQKIKELETKSANPENTDALLELGHLYNDSGFFEKAIETYKKYLTKYPQNADVIIDLGVCYFNIKNYDEAEKVMKSALLIKPDHQIGKFNLGIVNFSKGDVETAKKWWRECISINPNSEIAIKAKSLLESH